MHTYVHTRYIHTLTYIQLQMYADIIYICTHMHTYINAGRDTYIHAYMDASEELGQLTSQRNVPILWQIKEWRAL